MIIDVHAHTSNRLLRNLHVATATTLDLKKLAKEFGVSKIVLMATYFPFKGTGVYNADLLNRINGSALFLPFGSLDAMNNLPSGLSELGRLVELDLLSGLKLYPGYQDFDLAGKQLDALYKMASAYNLPVAIHSGELHHCCPKNETGLRSCLANSGRCPIDELGYLSHPSSIAGVVRKFPAVNFILSHLSNPFFEELRQVMRECPNVYTDISGQFLSESEESTAEYKTLISGEIKKFLDLPEGTSRLMFGTDFPIQSYNDSIELVESLGLSANEKKMVYFKNAARLLGLKEA
ncbi:MAG: amidohydrolase family protein [Candidatus Buchananbacteria bacterium]|nr:amidohydrolase family protein [Candidatus Buchananbacteria bacterium]